MPVDKRAYDVRNAVVERLKEDLLGGSFDDLLMDEKPLDRFAVGVLFPEVGGVTSAAENVEAADKYVSADGDAGGAVADEDDDPGVSLARVRKPSTMGLTFTVDAKAQSSIRVNVAAARYRGEGPTTNWRRETPDLPVFEIDMRTRDRFPVRLAENLTAFVVVREATAHGVSITVALRNEAVGVPGKLDADCWFNPRITIEADPGVFVARPTVVTAGADKREQLSQELLFRETPSYAVGHGCAVIWNESVRPTQLETTFLPTHELLLSLPAGPGTNSSRPAAEETDRAASFELNMSKLATDSTFDDIEFMLDDYARWIASLEQRENEFEDDLVEALQQHVRDAREAEQRMREGLRLLREDGEVRRAFQLMNLAMAQQRARQDHHRAGNIGDPPSLEGARWYPFQIGFVLTNLRGLTDPDSRDRKIADVLWFPTGGGKTEAYLGLIAIAILLRRIRNREHEGVSVIMRYTLRLLTLQQYERAAGLICALEELRRRELPDSRPISIGLWVGQASTPNKIDDARKALNRARSSGGSGPDNDESDPVQLRSCPWCGTSLDHQAYVIVDNARMEVRCPNPTCFFRHGLPVHIVDDDVYANRPSLIIATVDKFAMMPWRAEVGKLLGADGSEPPPDLIVQDELHLISGPLGTMVGLYETAIDAICSTRSLPKLVASTATIRRAAEQVRAVFAREARQFPPPGASQRDSYFAVEATAEQKGSREYVGVMAPASSHTSLMVRVYASLLQSAAQVPEGDEHADLYWTLLGYFNSLRVLGGAYIQVLDDVPDQIKVVAARREEEVRQLDAPHEMTSRKRSSEIPAELKALGQRRGETDSADVVLATNMISVGVDIDRLGLMAVMGQPQSSSEYIQATSRVGRKMPGLVVTIYNAARTRDLSHYENFTGYHRALYRHVEGTGATPFAPRARDRGLHGVLVSLARHTIPEAAPSRAAGHAHEWPDAAFDRVKNIILERVENIRRLATEGAPKGQPAVFSDDENPALIREELHRLVENWTGDRDVRHYEGWGFAPDARHALLGDVSEAVAFAGAQERDEPPFPPTEPPWPTLTSMRDVDAESGLFWARRRRSSRGED